MPSKLRELFADAFPDAFPGADIRQSRYGVPHALIACVVLCGMIFAPGFPSFWRQFIHGLNQTMTPKMLLLNLGLSTGFFSLVLLVVWLTARFMASPTRGGSAREVDAPRPNRLRAVLVAAVCAPLLTLIALGLNWLGAHAIEWCTGVRPADQELVKCFLDGSYPLSLRVLLVVTVMLQAPLLEEAIFRGIIFRGLAKSMSVGLALALSSAFFALVHVNAASFVAVWFLGSAFAWLYLRTRTILAPMTAHFLFNATNVALLLFFPELAT